MYRKYSEKRAELDYEISIRSYRKLIAMEKQLETLQALQKKENIHNNPENG